MNLIGTFTVIKAVLPGMLASGWGRIINVASSSLYTNTPGMTAYMSSKAGLLGLTSALAAELGDQGVTVNAVSPGYTRTNMVEASIAAGEVPANVDELVRAGQAIGKPASASDMAASVLFLTGPGSDMITAQFIVTDAGLTRHF